MTFLPSRVLPDSVQIVLPPEWFDIPLDRSAQATFVDNYVATHGEHVTASDRRQLELVVAQLSQLVAEHHVVMTSCFVMTPDNEGDNLVAATLAVSTIDRADVGSDVPLVCDVILRGITSIVRNDARFRVDEIEPPSVVEVAATQSVRLRQLVTFQHAQGQRLQQFEQRYLIPVADGDALVVVSFSTINLKYAKQFSELFEKIAGTLRILYPDDPTFEPEPESDE